MKAVIVTLRREGSKIHLFLRNEKGKHHYVVVDFKPYFYVPDRSGEYFSLFGERVTKIIVDDPSDVPKLRQAYPKHFEADIPYVRRFMIDADIFYAVSVPDYDKIISWRQVHPAPDYDFPLRIWYLDIEVEADILPTADNPVYPIIAVTFFDSYIEKYITLILDRKCKKHIVKRNGDGYVVYCPTENDLLFTFLRFFNKLNPDIITGWNIHFDIDYLKARMKQLDYSFDLTQCEVFDLLEAYRKLFKRPSYRLKDIALEEGIKKSVITVQEAMKAYRNGDIDFMVKYNRQDVEIVVELDRKYRIIDYYNELRKASGVVHLEDTLFFSIMLDTLLLRLARKRGIVLPSKPEKLSEKHYRGAIVFDPPKGIIENVAVFDMSRYYPSIIISFNISPETKIGKQKFKLNPKGLLPELCEYLLKQREKYEKILKQLTPGTPEYEKVKMKRNVVKFLVNAVYGFTAFEKSRIFDVDVAATVTALAREGILMTKEICEKELGYKVVYGDTDSIMIQVPFEKAPEVCEYLNKRLEEYFKQKYGLKEVRIRLKFEKYFRRVFFKGVKKRYVAHVVWEGKPCDYVLVKGFEVVRTDTPKYSKYVLQTFFEKMIKGASRTELISFLRKALKDFKKQSLSDIAIPVGFDKELSEYKSRPPHVRGALLANMYLGCNIRKGSRAKMLYVKHVYGLPKTDVIVFEDEEQIKDKVVVDYDRMIDVTIRKKLEDILRILGISWMEVQGKGVVSLSKWLAA